MPDAHEKADRVAGIAIVGDLFGFPHGMGATSRVFAYAKGFLEHGVPSYVFCARPTEFDSQAVNSEQFGMYEGIAFEYTSGRTREASSFVGRRVLEARSGLRLLLVTWLLAREGRLDAVIVYSRSVRWILTAVLAARIAGVVCLHEDVEYPHLLDDYTARRGALPWLYGKTYKLFDGCLAISTFLRDYCALRLRRGARVLLVPIMVDPTAFVPLSATTATTKSVAYSGGLDHAGEVEGLMSAFAAATTDLDDWRLWIIGTVDDPGVVASLKKRAEELGIGRDVEFIGFLRRTDLQARLAEAGILALPRSSGVFSKAGLPTKLGEYLATGRPVLTTDTGDIPRYLSGGLNAFVVPADDEKGFSAMLRYVMTHPEEAAEVGRRGRDTAGERFDHRMQAARVLAFVAELRDERRSRRRGGSAR